MHGCDLPGRPMRFDAYVDAIAACSPMQLANQLQPLVLPQPSQT